MSYITSGITLQGFIRNLIGLHTTVCKEIENLITSDNSPANFIKQLTRPIEALVCIIVFF